MKGPSGLSMGVSCRIEDLDFVLRQRVLYLYCDALENMIILTKEERRREQIFLIKDSI